MTVEFIKYAFISGELSPTLFGRTDLEKYDLGLALAYNGFVDYRGGLSSRPGTEFVDYVMDDDKATKFFPFKFAPDVEDTYVLLFGHEYIRFIQEGSYVLEAAVSITDITQASPGVVTANGHGYSTGDWVKIFDVAGMEGVNTRTFEVGATTTNTFELLDPFGNNFDTAGLDAYTSGGEVFRIYTVTSPYAAEDLDLLRAHQSRNLVRLTHEDYAPRDLIRNGDTNWSLSETDFGNSITVPTGLSGSPSTSGSAGMVWTVTAVGQNGEESLASEHLLESASVQYNTTAGSYRLNWNAVVGAAYYNVYRSNIIPDGSEVSRAMLVGFVGSVYGPEFIDNNITPDFATTPPDRYNPFANGAIDYIEITNGGSGYNNSVTVGITDPNGTGFQGYPVVNASGVIIAVVITNRGAGYTSPSVSFSGGGGTGATADAEVGDASGNWPAISTVFQQRQVYAATVNQPLTVWGSRRRLFDNFDVSRVITDLDSYEYDIDSEEAAPLRHLMPMRSGVLIFSESGVWLLTGGEEEAVTATNALADPQSYTGCSLIFPIQVDTDLLYIESKGSTIRLLSYNDLSRVYSGQDVSILSSHLFTKDKQIVRWGYAREPFKLVWAIRNDGAALSFTLVREQNVFAWTQNWTKGLFKDVLAIQEGNVDKVYFMVQRYINGRWTKMIETLDDRDFTHVEDAWCVDSGLALPVNRPDATLTPGAATGDSITFTASSGVFSAGNVGDVIRAGGGKAIVTAFTDSQNVVADIARDISSVVPEDDGDKPLDVASGDWSIDTPVSSVGGLWHLEGEEVSILADGNVEPRKTVSGGSITLDAEASRVIVGLPFRMRAQTLPPTAPQQVIEGRRKRLVGTSIRLEETRGLKIGATFDRLYEMKERSTQAYGEPIELQDGTRAMLVEGHFDRDAVACFEQTYPLPVTLLGLVLDMEIGDDAN